MDPLLLATTAIAGVFIWGNAIVWSFKQRHLCIPTLAIGKSMEPTIPRGGVLAIQHYPLRISEGDIVTFKAQGALVCHRVMEVDGDELLIKGDNNPDYDGTFHKDRIISKALTFRGEPVYLPLTPMSVQRLLELRTDNYKDDADK